MRKSLIIAVSIMGVVIVVLAVALASVGTHLDDTRIERDELKFNLEDLQQQADALSAEREQLDATLKEQRQSVDRLKADLERARSQAQAQGSGEPPAPAPATTP